MPVLLILALAALVSQAPHASHRLAPIPLEILERPVTIQTGIGRAHDDAGTSSKEAQALYDQGLAYLHHYAWIEAARSFNAALRLDGAMAMSRVGLSLALVELNRPSDAQAAIAEARRFAAISSDHVRRHVEARALQMAAEERPGEPARLAAYRQALDQALAAFPGDVEFVLLRGLAESPDPAERGQGSTLAAVKHYERALAAKHFAARHYLAHAFENSGRMAESLEQSAALARAAPSVPHARHMHGHSLRRSGRTLEAIVEFEAADRLHREYAKRERIPLEYDWHHEHNLGLLATSLQHAGQMKRAEALLREAFALPTGLLVQAYNKREWPMFLRARGRLQDAETAARALIANANPVIQATGHIESGLTLAAANRWGDASTAHNTALRLLRTSPGGPIAASALLALQGEIHLRTADRTKGRAMFTEVATRVRAAPGPDAWSQALFTLEGLARTARAVGDWELAGQMARQLIEHDPAYAGSHYALALVAEHDGDAATAKAEFAQVVTLWARADPNLPELVEARRKMK